MRYRRRTSQGGQRVEEKGPRAIVIPARTWCPDCAGDREHGDDGRCIHCGSYSVERLKPLALILGELSLSTATRFR